MTNVALSSIELCAGVGMLGEGFRAACEFLGIEHRTVCYVEREAPAAGQLVTLMEAGALDPAAVWSDLLTFPGERFSGKVDFLIAGFPCQDLSIAGRRAGLDGKRSGLFFDILDIADASGAWGLALENVSAIASASASVVDEAEGALEERAAARVVGELADRGWHAEWLPLSASDVGASHGRARWFCLAWRMADDPGGGRRKLAWPDQRGLPQQDGGNSDGAEVGHAGLQHQHLQQWQDGTEHPGAGQPVAHAERAERAERGTERVGGIGSLEGDGRERREADGGARVADAALGNSASAGLPQPGQPELPAQAGRGLLHRPELAGRELGEPGTCRGVGQADASGNGRHEGRPESGREQGRPDAAQCSGAVFSGVGLADTGKPGLSDTEPGKPGGAGRRLEGGAATQFRGAPLFAPGPSDPIWRDHLGASRLGKWRRAVTDDEAGSCPWAPAIKPGVRMLVDGLAIVVDESRNHQLRQVGNGVVPLCAAVAFVELLRRAGFAR